MSIKQGLNDVNFIKIEGEFITKIYVWENSVQKTIYNRKPPVFYRSKIPYVSNPTNRVITFTGGYADYFSKKVYDITASYEGSMSGGIAITTGDVFTSIPVSKYVDSNYQKIPYTATGTGPQSIYFKNIGSVNENTRTISSITADMERYSGFPGMSGVLGIGNKSQSYTWEEHSSALYTASVTFNDVVFTQSDWDVFYKITYKGSKLIPEITYAPSDFNQFYY